MAVGPMIEITYCRLCGWGLRAGWMAQELLTTFAEELGSVTLTPDGTGGVFEVRVNNEVIWSRKEQGRFPELKEIKQLIRDRVAPGRSLGHTDAPRPHCATVVRIAFCSRHGDEKGPLPIARRRKPTWQAKWAVPPRRTDQPQSRSSRKFSALLKMLRAGLC